MLALLLAELLGACGGSGASGQSGVATTVLALGEFQGIAIIEAGEFWQKDHCLTATSWLPPI
ncbi:MAG: hypothetical protein WAN26_09940 [Steroidobacteraceae bacterium]